MVKKVSKVKHSSKVKPDDKPRKSVKTKMPVKSTKTSSSHKKFNIQIADKGDFSNNIERPATQTPDKLIPQAPKITANQSLPQSMANQPPPQAKVKPLEQSAIQSLKETESKKNVLITSTEPTPIFKDDTPKIVIPDVQIDKIDRETNAPKIIAIILFAIMGLFWIFVIILSFTISTGPHEVLRNVTAISYVGNKTSFDNLVSIKDLNYKENVTVLGYLSKEIVLKEPLNITTTYVVDDYGNKIKLSFRYANLSATYDKLFYANRVTKNTYNVSGVYRFAFNEFILDVNSINAQPKELNEIRTVVQENVTEGPKAGVTFNIATGMKKVLSTFK